MQRWESAYGLCKRAKVRVGEVHEGSGGFLKRGTGEGRVEERIEEWVEDGGRPVAVSVQKCKGGQRPEEAEGRVEGCVEGRIEDSVEDGVGGERGE